MLRAAGARHGHLHLPEWELAAVRLRNTAALVLLAGLAGCASCDSVPDAAVTDCNAQIVPGGAAADLLFVIDDSGSMSQEQDELSANLGAFIDQLLGSAIALDVRLGVTNTSIEDYTAPAGTTTPRSRYGNASGGLAFPGAPGTPYPAGTLVAIDLDPQGAGTAGHFTWGTAYDDPAHATSVWGGPRILSSSAATAAVLARDFKANVKQGVWGASREQPLSAMRRALQKAGCPGPNCGFLRAGARLAVVILTDEDDCSGPFSATINNDGACQNQSNAGLLDPLADYADYLDTTIGGPDGQKPIVVLIASYDGSPLAPALCNGASSGTTTQGYSVPRRLDAFLDLLDPVLAATTGSSGPRAMKASICQPFARTLQDIASAVIPQTMPLRQAPADYRMMAVAVQKASGATVPCQLEPAGSGNAGSAGVVYTPAPSGGLASLTFQGACKLGLGDKVDLRIVCAR